MLQTVTVLYVKALLSELETRLAEPTARGLAGAVTRAVREGVLTPGQRLPPIRAVAVELGLSPTTVSAAWALLARTGAIQTDGRRGTTVAAPRRAGSPRYERALDRESGFELDLSTGVPDPGLLPDLARALVALTAVAAPGSYLDDPVLPELADVLRADWPYPAPALTVVDGAMDGLELTTRVLLGFGDRVAVEDPCFPPLLDLLEAGGAEIVAIPVDAEGMSVSALRAAGPVGAVFLQPRAHNPTGVSLTSDRAARLAAAVGEAIVVEDDSAGAIASSAALSLGTHLPERTVHVRSFAKSHGPDLRLAALSGPAGLVARIEALRHLGQGWSSRLLQRLLLGLLTDQRAVAQVARARLEYERRRVAVVDALAGHGVEVGGTDGINIWLPVVDETAAVVRLAGNGIGVTPGAPFWVAPRRPPHIRVTVGLAADGHQDLAHALAVAARETVRFPV